jgi:hypothetical protein
MSAGVIAGLLYAFNAHVLTRFPHVQAQHVAFFPIVLYALDQVLDGGGRRHVALLAAAFVLQALCSNYLLVFAAFAVVAATAVRPADWWTAGRQPVRLNLAIAAVIVVALIAPFLWPYYQVSREHGLARSLDEVARYSAGWRDYLVTGGRMHYAWWSHAFYESRTALFPGVTAIALVGVALATGTAWRDRRARMALAVGILGVAFSFGPGLPGYAWLHQNLPVLGGIRNAARWGWLALAAVSILAGFGVAQLEQRWLAADRPLRARSWLALCSVLGLAATAEAIRTPVGFTPFTGVSPIYDVLAGQPDAVLAEFPLYAGQAFNRNGPYLLNNTRSFTRLVNGYSGFQSAQYLERAKALASFPGSDAMAELKRLGATHVTVHAGTFAARSGREALEAVERAPELERVAEDGAIRLYRVR